MHSTTHTYFKMDYRGATLEVIGRSNVCYYHLIEYNEPLTRIYIRTVDNNPIPGHEVTYVEFFMEQYYIDWAGSMETYVRNYLTCTARTITLQASDIEEYHG